MESVLGNHGEREMEYPCRMGGRSLGFSSAVLLSFPKGRYCYIGYFPKPYQEFWM